MKTNRFIFFITLVILTGCALVFVDVLLLLFFGLPINALIKHFSLPALLFIGTYAVVLGMSSKCFKKKYFHDVTQEVYISHLKTIGAVPIKMIGLNVVLHAAFLSIVFFSNNNLGLEPAMKTPLYLASLSFGILVGTFIYVMCDGLVSNTLIDFDFNEYPRDLREGRQALKAMIIPVAVSLMSVLFTCAITLLGVRIAGGNLNDLQGSKAWSVIIIPIIVYLICVIILALNLKKNSALLYTSVINQLENLSSEQKDLTKRITVCSVDEIGTITGMINAFSDNLSNGILGIIKNKVNALTNTGYELSVNMKKTSDAVGDISDNFEQIKELEKQQESESAKVNSAVDEIKVSIEQLTTLIDEQTVNVNTSSSAIEQMTANINSVNNTLAENAKNVDVLMEAAEVGKTGLKGVVEKIQEIAKDSEGLLEINSLMNSIAAQTNLLSMNAAIEAAHAGEAGKGFAVVADEIRKLAETSGKQSKTTASMLKQIKASIDIITNSSNEVLARFEAIDTGVKTVAEHEHTIRNAMEEQSVGGKQILESIGRLKDITHSVENSSEHMEKTGKELIEKTGDFINTSNKVINSMNIIVDGAMKEIETSVRHVNEMSNENNKNFEELKSETEKYKVTDSKTKKILVIDDEKIHLDITRNMLEEFYEITTSPSAKEALALFYRGLNPDLILLDLIMPDMDGWSTFERIKAISNLHSVPIAFLTASDDPANKQKAKEVGAAEYFVKPVTREDLLERIAKVIRK